MAMSVYRSVKLLHPQKLTAGYPKMMVWKIWTPYQKLGHFWYQFVKFLECKTVISLFFGPEKWFAVWDRWEELCRRFGTMDIGRGVRGVESGVE